MTRINCIPVTELRDLHLGAEYRELPRVYRLVWEAIMRGERPTDPRNPAEYTLGAGHVRFFYPRLGWLTDRFYRVVAECHRRGRECQFTAPPGFYQYITSEWRGDWVPTEQALAINRARIWAKTTRKA